MLSLFTTCVLWSIYCQRSMIFSNTYFNNDADNSHIYCEIINTIVRYIKHVSLIYYYVINKNMQNTNLSSMSEDKMVQDRYISILRKKIEVCRF